MFISFCIIHKINAAIAAGATAGAQVAGQIVQTYGDIKVAGINADVKKYVSDNQTDVAKKEIDSKIDISKTNAETARYVSDNDKDVKLADFKAQVKMEKMKNKTKRYEAGMNLGSHIVDAASNIYDSSNRHQEAMKQLDIDEQVARGNIEIAKQNSPQFIEQAVFPEENEYSGDYLSEDPY